MTSHHRGDRGRVCGALPLILLWTVTGSAAGTAQVSIRVNKILQVEATASSLQNCLGLRDVLASLDDPSIENRYLIRLEPGIYDCQTQTLPVPEGVVIEGAGVTLTKILGEVDSQVLGVVHMVDATELRSLSVHNAALSPSEKAIAVSVWEFTGTPQIRLVEVTLFTSSGTAKSASVEALAAIARIWRSHLVVPLRATLGSYVEVSHSDLSGGHAKDAASTVICRYTSDGFTALGLSCL